MVTKLHVHKDGITDIETGALNGVWNQVEM